MSRRRVAKGRAARERRYEAAVRRQVALVRSPRLRLGPIYADPDEFLRRGDTVEMFDDN